MDNRDEQIRIVQETVAGKEITLAHIMGTDNMGRDIFSRVLSGAGTTFLISLCEFIPSTLFSGRFHLFARKT